MNQTPSMAGLASLVQSRGRNGDSVLVHMTPGEVQGLQSLALAHGGSLTLNPDTGLVEANFLKKLLPSLLGFGLNFLFPGLGALGSGLLVGAGETIRTGGDLGKGLMAGLGAFGGAGIGSALSGAAKAGSEAALQEITTTAAQKAATEAAKTAGTQAATETAKQGLFSLNPNMSGTLQSYGQGIKALGNQFGREGFMNAIPGGTIGKGAMIMSAANALTPDMEVPEGAYNIDDSYYESMGYSPEQGRFLGGQWRKGYPGFPGYADGGSVNESAPLMGGDFTPTGVAPDRNNTVQAAPQSLEQYYQSLLAPPAPRPTNPAVSNYLQDLNKFVTSPVAPPPPPAAAPPGTPGGGTTTPPGGGTTTNPGGTTGGVTTGGTNTVWDPNQGKFVSTGGSPGDTGMDLSGIADLVNSGMFSGFNFGDLGNYLQNGGYGDTTGLTYNPTTGTFGQPGSQTVNTPPGANLPKFDPNQSDLTYGQAMNQAQGNLTGIDQFADPMYSGMDDGFSFDSPFRYAGGGTIQKAAAGKLVTGDGDGMSDDIRANINGDQEARLADGEFVIPADVVSHLGNGSTDAGADRLYSMMDRIRKARTGRKQQAPEIDAEKYLPA